MNDDVISRTQGAHRALFYAFCKKTMKFEARNSYRAIKWKSEREISLNYLAEEYHFEPPYLDDYPLFQSVPRSIYSSGQTVTIENELLDAALLCLPEENRELILLLYFWGFKEKEVAVMYGRPAAQSVTTSKSR